MTNIATASIPTDQPQTHLTSNQQRSLWIALVEELQTRRNRLTMAAAGLDDFSDTDSARDREIANENLVSLLSGARQLEEALERLDTGNYGNCRSCDLPIPFERLEALPEVDLCVGCVNFG